MIRLCLWIKCDSQVQVRCDGGNGATGKTPTNPSTGTPKKNSNSGPVAVARERERERERDGCVGHWGTSNISSVLFFSGLLEIGEFLLR